ncbi:MAG: type II toxin-antitoxin system RelE/ParE family toxin [Patescibacteria group bacterium]
MFEIFYHYLVVQDDIPKLSAVWKKNIKRAIETKLITKLITKPEVYGKPLRRSLKNYRKLRVGDYRIIFRVEGNKVKVFAIKHRSEVYLKTEKRI